MPIELHVDFRLGAEVRGFPFEVRFVARPGITVLFGPSGAGKSTTLSVIAGLVRPSAGKVRFGDETWLDTDAQIDRPVEARGVAYVFQSLALFPHLSALENVRYGIDPKRDDEERTSRAREWLTRMNVEHLAERRPSTFSGGEAQRVALARAFAMRPRLVLLDEAFSSLDRPLRTALNDVVRRSIEEAKIPAIHVTHDEDEARSMGDQVVQIDRGRVITEGSMPTLRPALSP